MAFQNNTNVTRVQKMIETLELILKSAQSNSAESREIHDMLQPLTDELAKLGINPSPPDSGQDEHDQDKHNREDKQVNTPNAMKNRIWGGNPPPWESVHQMAEHADLKDLTRALTVYLTRIDEFLSDNDTRRS